MFLLNLQTQICIVTTLLFLTTTTFAHEVNNGHWRDELYAFKVHQIIKELYDIDFEDVNKDVTHDHNNFEENPSTECGYRGGHSGYDVAHKEDEIEIHSLTDGVVIKTLMPDDPDVDLSYIVVYNREYHKTIFYVHLSHIEIDIGDKVRIGNYIGDQGLNSDFSTGYHIHLEVRDGISFFPSCGAGVGFQNRNEDPIECIFEMLFEHRWILAAPSLSNPSILTQTWGDLKSGD